MIALVLGMAIVVGYLVAMARSADARLRPRLKPHRASSPQSSSSPSQASPESPGKSRWLLAPGVGLMHQGDSPPNLAAVLVSMSTPELLSLSTQLRDAIQTQTSLLIWLPLGLRQSDLGEVLIPVHLPYPLVQQILDQVLLELSGRVKLVVKSDQLRE